MDPKDPEDEGISRGSTNVAVESGGFQSPAVSRLTFSRRSLRVRPWIVSSAILCVLILLTSSSLSSVTDHSNSSTGLKPNATLPGNPQNSSFDYPFAVSPALFPAPSQLSASAPTSHIQLVASPTTPSTFDMINASTSGGEGAVWFESATYSAAYAAEIQLHSCYANCSTMPLLWSHPIQVASFNTPVSSDALVAAGDTLLAAISSGGTTHLYQSTGLYLAWKSLGSAISGTVNSIATTPSAVSVATLGSTSVTITSFTLTGSEIGSATVSPSASGATGILSTGSAYVPSGGAYLEVTAMSVLGSNVIQFSTSSNGGASFSTPTSVAVFNGQEPNPALDSVGQTRLSPPSSTPGEMAMTSVGSMIFLIWSTQDSSGQVQIMTEGSNNSGRSWSGPFNSGPINGAVQNLSLSVSPTGLIYATWIDPDYGVGGIDEAIYFADGIPIMEPTALAQTGSPANAPTGSPAIAVDGFQRPFVAWPSENSSTNDSISFSGQFLSINRSLDLVSQVLTDPLVPADFLPANSSTESTFDNSVTAAVDSLASDTKSPTLFCSLQTVTVDSLYAKITAVSINTTSTVCDTKLGSNGGASSIEPDVGVFAPNTYLATYGDWLLESEGLFVQSSPLANLSVTVQPVASLPSAVFKGLLLPDNAAESITATPSLYDPTSFELGVSASYPSSYAWNSSLEGKWDCGGEDAEYWYHYSMKLHYTGEQVWVNSAAHDNFTGGKTYLSPIWFASLPPYQTYTWNVEFSLYYYYNVTKESNFCSSPSYSTATESLTLNGQISTTLSILDGGAFVDAWWKNHAYNWASISYEWNTTMPAYGSGTLYNETTPGTPIVVSDTMVYQFSEDLSVTNGAKGNDSYSALANATSRPGEGPPAGTTPVFYYDQGLTSSPEVASSTCSFVLAEPNFTIGGNRTSNVTSNSATFSFSSTTNHGTGFVSYWSEYWGYSGSVSSIPAVPAPHGEYSYQVELHGLIPWMVYSVEYGISYGSGCVVDHVYAVAPDSITTPPIFPAWEQDLPYDSISHTGGGAEIEWTIPTYFLANGPILVSGNLSYEDLDTGSRAGLTISQTELFDPDSNANDFALNLTLPNLNDTYCVFIQLNYTNTSTLEGHTNATGSWVFVYEKDSSGDGLTDVEKETGWVVPLPLSIVKQGHPLNTCPPSFCPAPNDAIVTANPAQFSTNGLVSDYVEKELGLNPNTLDTAGSGMLDTWNLTFNLQGFVGWNSFEQFNVWNESTTYNPFNTTVPYAPGLYEKGYPLWANLTNLTPCPASLGGGIFSGDGSPYAAEVLWSSHTLTQFLTLWIKEMSSDPAFGGGPDPLRAVIGYWDGIPTLTVWGKLSWGANPLAASTPNDGMPDGARINPLGGTDVQLTVKAFSVTSGLSAGNGVATYINAYSPQALPYVKSNTSDYQGYTVQATAGSNDTATFSGNFVVTFPVAPTEQVADLNLSVVENISTSSSPKPVWALNTSIYSIDLTKGAYLEYPANSKASLAFTWKILPVYSKAPTWILAPPNNTTFTPLPTGLSRYTAEQDFDLLVLNDTAPKGTASSKISVANVFGPQLNWKYSITLLPGPNNILIPRSLFLASPLGQTLINATGNIVVPSRHQDSGLTFNPYNWLPRILNTTGNYLSSSFISMFSSTAQTGTSGAFGGVADNPSLEAGYESRQVQAVLWVNVSSSGYGSNLTTGAAELTDLLGGLLLNQSGNLTGNLLNETSELPTLGFSSNVCAALANASYQSNGAYGTPVSKAKPSPAPTPWWDVVASDIWNAFTGVVTVVAKIVSVVWNGAIAASVYLADAASALSTDLGITTLASQTIAAIQAVGHAMWTALQDVLNYILSLVKATLMAVVTLFANSFNSEFNAWNSAWTATSNVIDQYYLASPPSRGQYQAAGIAQIGQALTPLLVLMAALATAAVVASFVLGPLDIAGGVLVGTVLGVLAEAFGAIGGGIFTGTFKGATSMAYGAVSSLSETIFNATEHPLTSSEALAIAVPDGDPFDAIGALAGLSGFIAAIFAAAAYGFQGGTAKWAAATMIGDIIAFGGGLLAVEAAVISRGLPSPSDNASVRQDYQADSTMAEIAFVFGVGGLIATGVASAEGGGIPAFVGFAISLIVIGAAIGVLISNHNAEGTDP